MPGHDSSASHHATNNWDGTYRPTSATQQTRYVPLGTCWNHYILNPTCECSTAATYRSSGRITLLPPPPTVPTQTSVNDYNVDTGSTCGDVGDTSCSTSTCHPMIRIESVVSIADSGPSDTIEPESSTACSTGIPDRTASSSCSDELMDFSRSPTSSSEIASLQLTRIRLSTCCISEEISVPISDLTVPADDHDDDTASCHEPVTSSSAVTESHPDTSGHDSIYIDLSSTADTNTMMERDDDFHPVPSGLRTVTRAVNVRLVPIELTQVRDLNRFATLHQIDSEEEDSLDTTLTLSATSSLASVTSSGVTSAVVPTTNTSRKSKKKSKTKKKSKKKKVGDDELMISSSQSTPDPDLQLDQEYQKQAKMQAHVGTMFETVQRMIRASPLSDIHRLLLDLYRVRLSKLPETTMNLIYLRDAFRYPARPEHEYLVDLFHDDDLANIRSHLHEHAAVLTADPDSLGQYIVWLQSRSQEAIDTLQDSFMERQPLYRGAKPESSWPTAEIADAVEACMVQIGLIGVNCLLQLHSFVHEHDQDCVEKCPHECMEICDLLNHTCEANWILALGDIVQAMNLLDDNLRRGAIQQLRERLAEALVAERPHDGFPKMLCLLDHEVVDFGTPADLDKEDHRLFKIIDGIADRFFLDEPEVQAPSRRLQRVMKFERWQIRFTSAFEDDMVKMYKILDHKWHEIQDEVRRQISERLTVKYDQYRGDRFPSVAVMFIKTTAEHILQLYRKMVAAFTVTMKRRVAMFCQLSVFHIHNAEQIHVQAADLQKLLHPIVLENCQNLLNDMAAPEHMYDFAQGCFISAVPVPIIYDIFYILSYMMQPPTEIID